MRIHKCILLTVFLIITQIPKSVPANILCVYLAPIKSHHVIFRTITEELIKRGHVVVLVTTDPVFKNNTPINVTEIDLHEESYKIWQKQQIDKEASFRTLLKARIMLGVQTFTVQYKSDHIQELIKKNAPKFDLILIDGSYYPSLYFSHVYKTPVIPIHCTGIIPSYHKNFGHLVHVRYYPGILQKRIHDLTIYEIFKACYEYSVVHNLLEDSDQYIQQLSASWPPLSELYNNIPLMLTNTHPVWEGIRPNPQRILHVSSLQCKTAEILIQDLQEYLDSSKNGVIYMSFGTTIAPSALSQDIVNEFMKAFAQLPFDILWKWNKDEMPGLPDNVRLFKWLPQADVLKHPKIKLFITQGGQHSTDEVIDAGVPLIGIPLLFDQFANTERYVRFGIGKRLDMATVTSEELKTAIETIIADNSYRQNIVKLRTLLHDKPMTSLDKAMWAVEYTLRHSGSQHLRSPSSNLTWAEYFELELLFYLLGVLVLILCLVIKSLLAIKRLVLRLVSRSNRTDRHYEKIL